MKQVFILFLLITSLSAVAQDEEVVLSFDDYINLVKQYHPVVKQANLVIDESRALVTKARGGFDPKFSVDYNTKQFKGTDYYNQLNTVVKVPTWYGIELKGQYEANSGVFLNSEATMPENGLYGLGVSVSLAKGLVMNKRMAALKKAKLYREQAKLDNQIMVNEILFDAAKTYFKWMQSVAEVDVYTTFLINAQRRFEGVVRSAQLGDKSAIDTVEAQITVQSRLLNLEKARLKRQQNALELSNFLWVEDVPVELQENVRPTMGIRMVVDQVLGIDSVDFSAVELLPKLQSLQFKADQLRVEQRLKRNDLLPEIDVQYNILNPAPDLPEELRLNDYKAGVAFKMPLFFGKARAGLRLTNIKMKAIELEQQNTRLQALNKIQQAQLAIENYVTQFDIADEMVNNYAILLKGEERKFQVGESSLFLINSREAKLIESKLKAIELENQILTAKGKLFNALGR